MMKAAAPLRAAIYARYSTDEQRPESIADQIESCRRECAAKGWTVVGSYSDDAMSGSLAQRPGYQRLKHDAARGVFDVVVVEALDRLSRQLSEIAILCDLLTLHRLALHTCANGLMSTLLMAVLGGVAQHFLEDLRLSGMRGKVLEGLSAGGLGFGYAVDPSIGGGAGGRRIKEDEAAIVRRIFELYAAGTSPRTIAALLNDEGVPGPGGRPWGDTTIRGQADRGTGILNNSSYAGLYTWNRCSYFTNPRTGKRVARPNPEEEWESYDVPELRIVDDTLWARVKTQQAKVRTVMARGEDGHGRVPPRGVGGSE